MTLLCLRIYSLLGRALSRSNLAKMNKKVNRSSMNLNSEKEDMHASAGMFIDEFISLSLLPLFLSFSSSFFFESWQVCDYGHTSHDIMKKVEEKYTQVERDILEDFGLYKDGVWLDKRKTLDWYKISSNVQPPLTPHPSPLRFFVAKITLFFFSLCNRMFWCSSLCGSD